MVWRLGIAMIVGGGLLLIRFRGRLDEMDLTEALWLVPYFTGFGLISFLGQFGTGSLKQIPFGWDLLLCILLSPIFFVLAVRSALSPENFNEYNYEEEKPDPKKPVIGL